MELSRLLVVFTWLCVANGMQRFEREPEYAIANPGDSVLMDCRVHNLKGKCIWQKDGKPVGQYAGKYEWNDNPQDGDCSLRILAARADLDAAKWECQVTASSFDAEDALTSAPALLAVRVAPSAPQMEFNSILMLSGSNLTVSVDKVVVVSCHSRQGNPVANIKWFIGETELTSASNQSNLAASQQGVGAGARSNAAWTALSTLTYAFRKSDNGAKLRCVAFHDAYAPVNFRESDALLDVHYAPQVRLMTGNSTSWTSAKEVTFDVEESADWLSLRCVADANPPATVIWRRLSLPPAAAAATTTTAAAIYSFNEEIHLRPVTRNDAATYTCQAKNDAGVSDVVTLPLDVKYAPIIRSVGPSVNSQLTVSLYDSTAKLECQAEANPPPSYQWLHRTVQENGQESIAVASNERVFHFTNVTYEVQGEYVCIAKNTIKGQERAVQSDAITVRVVGPPQVLHEVSSRYMSVERGEDAVISAIFCADPRPIKVSWRWASYRMEAGDGSGRFIAEALQKVTPTLPPPPMVVDDVIAIPDADDVIEQVTNDAADADAYDAASELRAHRYEATSVTVPAQSPPHAIFTYPGKRDECYETRLRIQRVELNDGRHYYLTVENEKGTDSFYVTLNVKEPIPMATVIAVGIACLFVIIVVTLCLLYAYRSERCCFNL